MGAYVADQRGNLHAKGLAISDNGTTGLLNPSLALLHDVGPAGVRVILAGATGILQGRELILTAHLNAGKLVQRGQREHVKDELLQLDTVGLLGLHSLAVLRVDAGDLLASNVVRQLVSPVLDRVDEAE